MTGVLTGVYMLLSGAIANYLAGVIADQTSQASFDASRAINYSINAYIEVFDQITWGRVACVGPDLAVYQALKSETARWRWSHNRQAPYLINARCVLSGCLPWLASSYAASISSLVASCDRLSVADDPASHLLSAPLPRLMHRSPWYIAQLR
ncbi:hypothetical protein ACLK11_03945 [Escherichia coli]